MDEAVFSAMARSERILAEKLKLLYRNTAAVLANLAIGGVVSALLWDVYPHGVLAGWLAAMAAVCAARLIRQRKFFDIPENRRCTPCAAKRFAIGAGASGLLWGILCLGLPVWGDSFDYILMAVAGAGMTAGAVTAIAIYYPAYVSYVAGFALPLIAVTISHPDRDIAGVGAMMIVYFLAISVTAHYTNRFINRTVELKVDNQALKTSLDAARVERDAARIEKWSTAAQLSHELRTPLNAILGFSETMNGEIFGSLGNSRYKEYTGHILASGQRLLTLIDELLLLSQSESGTLTLKESEFDVVAVLHSVADAQVVAAAKAGLVLECGATAGLPFLKADRAKLRQILVNLVDNAVKFTSSGGIVRLTAETRSGGVLFAVNDTGIGISPDQISKALEPFGRIAAPVIDTTPGAGLGLPIAKRLAELHGAVLEIKSAVGEGTTCTIAFPASRSIAAPAAAIAAA